VAVKVVNILTATDTEGHQLGNPVDETIPTSSAEVLAVVIIAEILQMPRTKTTFRSITEWIRSGGRANVSDGSAMKIVRRLSKVPAGSREKVYEAILGWINSKIDDGTTEP
jgi:hypothetical protein